MLPPKHYLDTIPFMSKLKKIIAVFSSEKAINIQHIVKPILPPFTID
jgi:hypothetical protein